MRRHPPAGPGPDLCRRIPRKIEIVQQRSDPVEIKRPRFGHRQLAGRSLEQAQTQIAPITLDFTKVRDRTYPDFIPRYDQVRVVDFEATGEILRLDHGMDFIAFLDSPTGLSVDLDLHFDLVHCEGTPETNAHARGDLDPWSICKAKPT